MTAYRKMFEENAQQVRCSEPSPSGAVAEIGRSLWLSVPIRAIRGQFAPEFWNQVKAPY